jgi:hypothetical protein
MSGNEERSRGIAAKSKHRNTLFDVLSEEQAAHTGLKKPRWMDEVAEPPRAPRPEAPPAAPAPTPIVVDPAPPRPEPAAFRTEADDGAAPPWIELADDRLRLSLTSVGCAVVVFVFALAVFAGYRFGQRRGLDAGLEAGYEHGRTSYTAEVNNEIELARSQPPTSEAVASLLDRPAGAAADTGGDGAGQGSRRPATGWIRDYTYIVVQEFLPGNEPHAVRAQAFLAERGVDTIVVTTARGSTQLVTTRGFNRDDSTQRQLADQLLAGVHRAGADYYTGGGGYKLEGYFRKLTTDSW